MIKPMRVALQIEDHRGADPIGRAKLFGFVTDEFKATQEVKVLVYDAVRSELENNGHRVLTVGESNADVIIEARVKKFWFRQKIATIVADVSLIDPRDKSLWGGKLIIGTFYGGTLSFGLAPPLLNGALAELIRNFSRDPDLLDAFDLAQQEMK
jgi:hypothetical protein